LISSRTAVESKPNRSCNTALRQLLNASDVCGLCVCCLKSLCVNQQKNSRS